MEAAASRPKSDWMETGAEDLSDHCPPGSMSLPAAVFGTDPCPAWLLSMP